MGRGNHRCILWSVFNFSTPAPFFRLEDKRYFLSFCSLRPLEFFAAELVSQPGLADCTDERFRNRFGWQGYSPTVGDCWLFCQSHCRFELAVSRLCPGAGIACRPFSVAPLRRRYCCDRRVEHFSLRKSAVSSVLEQRRQFRSFPESQANRRSFRSDLGSDFGLRSGRHPLWPQTLAAVGNRIHYRCCGDLSQFFARRRYHSC